MRSRRILLGDLDALVPGWGTGPIAETLAEGIRYARAEAEAQGEDPDAAAQMTIDNYEPDLRAELLWGYDREGRLTEDERLRLAIADGYDPEQIGYPSDELQEILEASPCYGMSIIEMADAGLADGLTHSEAVALERLRRWGVSGEPSDG